MEGGRKKEVCIPQRKKNEGKKRVQTYDETKRSCKKEAKINPEKTS